MKKSIENVDFYHDFMQFIHLLYKRPLEKTATGTGNLKRKEVKLLGELFRFDIYQRDKEGNILWDIYTENDVPYIQKIRQISSVMYLTYNRGGYLKLSKNGESFIKNLSDTERFKEIVLWYFYRCNWVYNHVTFEYEKRDLISDLQTYQNSIWLYLINNKEEWTEIDELTNKVIRALNIKTSKKWGKIEIESRIEWFLEGDLMQFGLIKCRRRPKEYEFQRMGHIKSFKITSLGEYIFNQALYTNFL